MSFFKKNDKPVKLEHSTFLKKTSKTDIENPNGSVKMYRG